MLREVYVRNEGGCVKYFKTDDKVVWNSQSVMLSCRIQYQCTGQDSMLNDSSHLFVKLSFVNRRYVCIELFLYVNYCDIKLFTVITEVLLLL